MIQIGLPRFTRRVTYGYERDLDLSMSPGEVLITQSTRFLASWVEGSITDQLSTNNVTNLNYVPFKAAELRLVQKPNFQANYEGLIVDQKGIPRDMLYTIVISSENGIGAYCGFPKFFKWNSSSTVDQEIQFPYRFYIKTNRTFLSQFETPPDVNGTSYNDTYYFDEWDGMGNGCPPSLDPLDGDCNGHGACNYCFEKCVCNRGYGSSDDILTTGRDINSNCNESEY
jgi:hypothetical protein